MHIFLATPLLISRTNAFPFRGVRYFSFFPNFNRTFCKKAVQNPYQTQYSAVSNLVLHSLWMSHKEDARLICGLINKRLSFAVLGLILGFLVDTEACGNAMLVQPGHISFMTSSNFLFTCPGTSLKKVDTILYFIFDNYDEFTCCGENQLGSCLISWLQQIWFYTVFNSVYILFHTVLKDLSQCMRFPTMWYVRPAKPQISLRIRAVWPEPLLVVWVFYDC